jgi:ferredoxin
MLTFQGPTESFAIEAEPQLNLLAHAQLDEWTLGSRCGGHGECGGDRIQIQNAQPGDFSPLTAAEIELIKEEDLNLGWRLACQCWPERKDLNVTILCPRLARG